MKYVRDEEKPRLFTSPFGDHGGVGDGPAPGSEAILSGAILRMVGWCCTIADWKRTVEMELRPGRVGDSRCFGDDCHDDSHPARIDSIGPSTLRIEQNRGDRGFHTPATS